MIKNLDFFLNLLYNNRGLSEKQKGGRTSQTSKYRIIKVLSVHQDSTVWLAEHKSLNVKRIIKGIRKTSPNYIYLLNEAHLLKNLKHPSIPEIFDLEEDDEFTYIIEQYIEGDSLKSLCNGRLLSEKEIFHFIIQLSNIIVYLHSLTHIILYLDIKPENIIISGDTCYLIDFGSARSKDNTSDRNFGTRSYASPEQSEGGLLTERSDIYSIGKLLDYMIDHSNISQKKEKALRKLANKCSEKKRWNRISSVKSIITSIKEIQNTQSRFSDKPIKIAFAGAGKNYGVTYIALLFAGFLHSIGRNCLYAEVNDSEAWYSLPLENNKFQALAGLEILSRKTYEKSAFESTDVIADYGCISEDMPEDFYMSDVVCILTGNRIWETEKVREARALSRKCSGTRIFLVNLSEKISAETAKAIEREIHLAIPYIADFDAIFNNREVKAVFQELATLTGIIKP